jgi:hypothetical protein
VNSTVKISPRFGRHPGKLALLILFILINLALALYIGWTVLYGAKHL